MEGGSDSLTKDGALPPKQPRMPSGNRLPHQNKDNSRTLIGGDPGNQSRKSTAVSSTSRIGSGGGTTTNQHKTPRAGVDMVMNMLAQKEQKPLYELSLGSKSKKPPHKLKPLQSAMANAKLKDLEMEMDTFQKKQFMKELDSELDEYLNADKIFTQMESAFVTPGSKLESTSNFKRTTSFSQKGKVSAGSFDPIAEEDSLQLVTYIGNNNTAEQRAKKNEMLKKRVKKLTSQG